MKMLIVDDDDVLLSVLTEKLEAYGYEVVPTHFGDGGLSLRTDHLNSFFPIIVSYPAHRLRTECNSSLRSMPSTRLSAWR
jgi:hypothetical protein